MTANLLRLLTTLGLAATISGCVSYATGDAFNKAYYLTPVLSDEVVAIGRPAQKSSSATDNEHVVAFVGAKNTYFLTKGGEDLEQAARLGLDSKRVVLTPRLYLKDKYLWGDVLVRYIGDEDIAPEQQARLEKGGFQVYVYEYRDSLFYHANPIRYQKEIAVEGVIGAPLKIPDAQLEKLTLRQPIAFFNSPADPPDEVRRKQSAVTALGVAGDMIVDPAMFFGFMVLILTTGDSH